MKSFLTSLSERAHGRAEVVQPRSRSRFEPDASGDNDTVGEEVAQEAGARPPVALPALPVEPRLGKRIVEIEKLLVASPTPAPTQVIAAAADTGPRRQSEAADPPTPSKPAAPAKAFATETPDEMISVARPADTPVRHQPVVRRHHQDAVPTDVSPFPVVLPSALAVPPGPPSVTIRIERVDVRAVPPATPATRPAATRRPVARPSLDDYLAARR